MSNTVDVMDLWENAARSGDNAWKLGFVLTLDIGCIVKHSYYPSVPFSAPSSLRLL